MLQLGGRGRNRTDGGGFAVRSITTLLLGHYHPFKLLYFLACVNHSREA